MWGISLSGPLDIVGLVSRYLSNYLMSRMPVLNPLAGLSFSSCEKKELWDITPTFAGLSPCLRLVPYALRTRLPVAIRVLLPYAAPRLACVKPAASVHPEPGSNSSLFLIFVFVYFFFREISPLCLLPILGLFANNNSMYSFFTLSTSVPSFHTLFPYLGLQMYTYFLSCKCFDKLFFGCRRFLLIISRIVFRKECIFLFEALLIAAKTPQHPSFCYDLGVKTRGSR